MRAAALAACAWFSACAPSPRSCHFGAEHAIWQSSGASFDDLALVWRGESALALFSDAGGLYARELDRDGLPRARAVRIGERCDAGVAAAVSGEKVAVACARRAGSVALYELLNPEHAELRAQFGPVGADSHGVALAAQGDRLALAFQDAAVGSARVRFARLPGSTSAAALSDPAWDASSPSLALRSGQLFAVWGETRQLGRRYESRVQFARLFAADGGSRITVATSRDPSPSPQLLAGPGGFWLGLRDRRKPARKTGLYVRQLDQGGHPQGRAARVGRADGVGRPVLRACLSGLVAAIPRTFAGDYFVGVVHSDDTLRSMSGEQQFYEDSHEFAQVASTCVGSHALLLIAERGRLQGGNAGLRSVPFACN